jgi:hypothetical protein
MVAVTRGRKGGGQASRRALRLLTRQAGAAGRVHHHTHAGQVAACRQAQRNGELDHKAGCAPCLLWMLDRHQQQPKRVAAASTAQPVAVQAAHAAAQHYCWPTWENVLANEV